MSKSFLAQMQMVLLDKEFDLVQNHREIARRKWDIGQLEEEREIIEKTIADLRERIETLKNELGEN